MSQLQVEIVPSLYLITAINNEIRVKCFKAVMCSSGPEKQLELELYRETLQLLHSNTFPKGVMFIDKTLWLLIT